MSEVGSHESDDFPLHPNMFLLLRETFRSIQIAFPIPDFNSVVSHIYRIHHISTKCNLSDH